MTISTASTSPNGAQGVDAGSYAFGQFAANDLELKRLQRQAEVAKDLEGIIWNRVGIRPGLNLLDLACGPGIVSLELARHIYPGTVTGVDLSPDLLRHAQDLATREVQARVSFRQGNVYELETLHESFDFVYARLLFQHLSRPRDALASIRRVLRKGGRLCIVDVDDSWLTLYPEPSSFQDFTRQAALGQQARGGDRFIGRKLPGLLREAGLQDVTAFVQPVTSFDIGLPAFLEITTRFKKEQIQAEYQEVGKMQLSEIDQILHQPGAWGAVGVWVATGVEPGGSDRPLLLST